MMFKIKISIWLLVSLFLLGDRSVHAQEIHRDNVIAQELDCVAASLEVGEGINWNDICYTWDSPQADERSKSINDMLDYHENSRAMASSSARREEPLGLSDQYYSGPRQSRQAKPTHESDPESWLKQEYPYFYKDHMIKKRKDQDYYSEYDKEDRHFFPSTDDAEGPSILPFLELIDYGFTVESNRKPNFYLEAMLPFYESESNVHTIFNQSRVSVVSNEDRSYSIGFGYRYFDANLPFVAGLNSFYDFQEGGNHYRVGYGGELFTEYAEARVNYYNALSSVRTLTEIPLSGTPPYFEYEQAVDGFDMELGAGIPRLSIAKIFGGFERYDHKHSDDMKAWTGRLELKPSSSMTFNVEYINQNDEDARYRFDGRLSFPFSTFDPRDIFTEVKGASIQPQPSDLVKRLRDRVERSNTIAVERWVEQGAEEIVPIPVGSGGDIQVQLVWDTDSDMDLHMNLPAGTPAHIYYAALQSYIGTDLFAELDVDDIPLSGFHDDHSNRDHVENIYVVDGQAVAGAYSPFVVAYNLVEPTHVTVNVFVGGQYVSTTTHLFTVDDEQFNLPNINYP